VFVDVDVIVDVDVDVDVDEQRRHRRSHAHHDRLHSAQLMIVRCGMVTEPVTFWRRNPPSSG